jgi:hypothetical protein
VVVARFPESFVDKGTVKRAQTKTCFHFAKREYLRGNLLTQRYKKSTHSARE